MSAEQIDARKVYLRAKDVPREELASFLDDACGGDSQLRDQVETLLAQDEVPDRRLSESTMDQSIAEKPGTQIGSYKVLQQIGQGGMGIVYLAEQKEPVERRVALKIIKPGMDSKQVIARFEAERRALAMMDHPSIAKVLDAGTTDNGRPFFVMELVKGIPITQYCDERQLTPKERLELFVSTCHAVQHAHQKGIIHRDIKPSNILIARYDGTPVPKVIDFGVAKATGRQLTDKTMFTQYGQIVGTIEYMSPEQAEFNQLDVDTRSDVYSLGVLLYELLTGDTPFDKARLRSAAFDEMLRIIREEEPPRPSTRLSSSESLPNIAFTRGLEPKRLGRLLRGELDWVVMKALEKDRGRRYETADALAADIERYMADEPVVACPPSAAYRLRKLIRRNKATFATAMTVSFAVVLGFAAATWQAIRATRAEREAVAAKHRAEVQRDRATDAEELAQTRFEQEQIQRERAEIAEAEARREAAAAQKEATISNTVLDFIQSDLLEQVTPDAQPDPDVTLRAVVDRAAKKLETRFDSPFAQLASASIHHTLAVIYQSLGQFETAERHGRKALKIHERDLGVEDRNTIRSRGSLAYTLYLQGRHSESESLYTETLEACRKVLPSSHPLTMGTKNGLGLTLKSQGQFKRAEKLHREVLESIEQRTGGKGGDSATLLLNLASAISAQGKANEATKLIRSALAIRRGVYGPTHSRVTDAMMQLANALKTQGKVAESIDLIERAYRIRRSALREDHASVIRSMERLIREYHAQGRKSDAVRIHNEMMRVDSDNPTFLSLRARCLARLGQWRLAREDWRRAQRHTGSGQIEYTRGPEWARKSAVLWLGTGDEEAYRRHSAHFASTWSETHPRIVVWIVGMNARPSLPAEQLVKLADAAIKKRDWSWTRFLAGSAQYRSGRFAQALVQFDRAKLHNSKVARYFDYWYAMTLYQLGRKKDAMGRLEQAESGYHELMLRCLASPAVADAHNYQWWHVVYPQIIRREAWNLINGVLPPDEKWQRTIEASLTESKQSSVAFEDLLKKHPEGSARYYERLAARRSGWKQWASTLNAVDRVIEATPSEPRAWYQKAVLLLASGDLKAYRDYYKSLLRKHGHTKNPHIAGWLSVIGTFGPVGVQDRAKVVELTKLNAKHAPESGWIPQKLAAAYYRNGDFRIALDELNQSEESAKNAIWHVLLLAKVHYKLGDLETAKAWLTKATAALNNSTRIGRHGWDTRIDLSLQRDEVARLFDGTKLD